MDTNEDIQNWFNEIAENSDDVLVLCSDGTILNVTILNEIWEDRKE